ncbi:MAG TPA: 2-amino-4-hydroxy-6-hydroxymethyldihydropteridine diphosphokinase [Casimicrobiaceae bacterium]|nr:2-amino-4-hydroxy-6-hydroxymethyldihydropteridine diphosphokinase [Casimicrobiaceae bacterium]
MATPIRAHPERLRNAAIAYIGLGSNLEHPRRQIARAIAALARLPRTRLVAASPNYTTEPIGTSTPQPQYVNAVVALSTRLSPTELLRRLLAIERRQRRKRDPLGERNAPRTLDCDLLLYGRRRLKLAQLTVPHPRMHQRAFVLRPLRDIAPAATIPGRGLARRHLHAVRDQRIARTRSHVLH